MLLCNLKMLLAERDLTSLKVSKDTGVSRTTLGSLINDHALGIQFDTLNTLCIYLGVEPGSFFLYVPYDIKIAGAEELSKHLEIQIVERGRDCVFDASYYVDVRKNPYLADDGSTIDYPSRVIIYVGPSSNDSKPITNSERAFFNLYEKMPIRVKNWIKAEIIGKVSASLHTVADDYAYIDDVLFDSIEYTIVMYNE